MGLLKSFNNEVKNYSYTCNTDLDSDNSNENDDLKLEPAAEDMENGKFPMGASMPVTDLYRRKHKTDSKSV